MSNTQRVLYPEIRSEIVSIDAEKASSLLANMIENQRSLSPKTAARYSKMMQKGQWFLSTPILISKEGKLLDGQHRLAGVIASKKAVDFIVTYGLPETAIEGIDMGKNRSVVNLAHLRGKKEFSLLHVAIYNGMRVCPAFPFYPPDLTKGEQIEGTAKYFEPILFAATASGGVSTPFRNAVFTSVIARAWHTQDRDRLKAFARILHTGIVEEEGEADSAAIKLARHYLEVGQTRMKGTSDRIAFIKKVTWSLGKFLERTPVKKSVLETSHNLFPVPELDEWWKARIPKAD